MKHILYIFTIIIIAIASFIVGRYDYYIDINNKIYPYNIKEHLSYERQYCEALLDGLHWYMLDDKEYWDTVFTKTKQYQNIEKANDGDWEDFYAPNWK